MNEHTTLIPSDIRTVEFYGDEIIGALIAIDGDPRIYVPLRPLCDALLLDWSSQRKRILRDDVLREEVRGVVIMTTPQGGKQETLCLPLDLLPGWLFGITTNKVKPDLKEKIVRYRRECYRRLWDTFKHDILRAAEPEPSAIPPTSGAALAYELATVVQNMAREQMELEARMHKSAQWAKGVDTRLTTLEIQVKQLTEAPITEAQAADLSLAVKAVAHLLAQQGTPNGYQRVYGELYRKQGITSYKSVPKSSYDAVMTWLKAWHAELGSTGS